MSHDLMTNYDACPTSSGKLPIGPFSCASSHIHGSYNACSTCDLSLDYKEQEGSVEKQEGSKSWQVSH